MKTEFKEEHGKALYDLLGVYEESDRTARQNRIKIWKKLDYFWHGIQYLDVGSDFQWESPQLHADKFEDITYYTKVYNIFRAHGESIIAALSVDLPVLLFPPDDADSSDDKETSKGMEDVYALLDKHNKSKLLLIKTLFYLYTAGLAVGVISTKKDKKYGTYKVPETGVEEVKICPHCGDPPQIMNGRCPNCGYDGEPIIQNVPAIVSYKDELKSREHVEIFGPLNVFIPSWVTHPDNIPVLRVSEDFHKNDLLCEFEDSQDLIKNEGMGDEFEAWGRQPFDCFDSWENLSVRHRVWFTPKSYPGLPSDLYEEIREEYPDGCRVTFVNKVPVEIIPEKLCDAIAVSIDPRSRNIHSDAVGKPLIPINEVTNELFNLTLESVEHGVPATFADPDVLDFQAYKESESRPGEIYPAKPRPGRSLGEAFETLKTASVSQEIDKFASKLEAMGQFVVGSFPSIYGGEMHGSRTAAEYDMSRRQSLQRLSTTWTITQFFWANLMEIACLRFVKNMQTDERFVRRYGNSYVNVWIRKTIQTGKIGSVEPEITTQFPVSSTQKRDFISRLFELANPEINQVLFHPANRATIARYTGFSELYVPGEHDHNKQIAEIEMLLQGQSAEDEQGIPVPSVRTDPQIDDAQIHIQVCKAFLNSERGLMIRAENPSGWQNVFAHLLEHQNDLAGQTQLPFETTPAGMAPETSSTTTQA